MTVKKLNEVGRLVTLRDLARMSNRSVNECLRISQEAKALRLSPEDSNIYVDVDVVQDYLDEVINEEIRVLNGRERED